MHAHTHMHAFLYAYLQTQIHACPFTSKNTHALSFSLSFSSSFSISLPSPLSLQLLSLNCSSLEELSLINTADISDDGIRYLIHGCKSIHSLAIKNDREKLRDSDFLKISGSGFDQPFPNLKHLVVGRCKLTDKGLGSITLNCTGLTRFEFYMCNDISSLGIFPFLVNSPELEHLELHDCSEIKLEDLVLHFINHFYHPSHNHADPYYHMLNRVIIQDGKTSDIAFVMKVNEEWVCGPERYVIFDHYLLSWFEFQNKTICLCGKLNFSLDKLIQR